ncbi:MAG: sporulation protein YunB [Clostridiales bacterium]|nr:sporulation protein YunB [Clostridiales bacterium]
MKRQRFRVRLGLCLLIFAIVVMICATCFELSLRPLIVNTAKSRARLFATNVISESVDEAFEVSLTDSKLVNVIYGDVGVKSIETDVYAINRLRTASIRNITGQISNIDKMTLEIPIGNLVGNSLLTGRGAPIKIRLVPIGDVSAELYSEFTESGINQTLHRIYLRVKVTMNMLVLTDTVKLELANDILVAETVIVGEIPDAYTSINRFEIDENEENDLNDYAATLP